MKNIFRKTVKKVRETAAKVSRTVKEEPTLIFAGVALTAVGVTLIGTMLEFAKPNKTSGNGQVFLYNVETVLDAVQNARDAFKAGYEAEPDADAVNLVKYGFTRDSAEVLSMLGLCDGPEVKRGNVYMTYHTPDEKEPFYFGQTIQTEKPDA
jgi:hypothetical protein